MKISETKFDFDYLYRDAYVVLTAVSYRYWGTYRGTAQNT